MQLVVLNTFYNAYKLHFQPQGKKNFENFFDKSIVNRIGKQSGFVQRRSKKITAFNFLVGFIISCCNGKSTYRDWAAQIGLLTNKIVSKQAVFGRVDEAAVLFAKRLLEYVLLIQSSKDFTASVFNHFCKVFIQDSSTLCLPEELADKFPGNYSHGRQKAVARIQSIVDLKTMKFIKFSLGAFTQNDQSANEGIMTYVSKGSLVIRDLGYFSIAVFEKIIKAKAHFLSRIKYGVALSDTSGKVLLIKDLVKGKRIVDKWVYIGIKPKFCSRLIYAGLS